LAFSAFSFLTVSPEDIVPTSLFKTQQQIFRCLSRRLRRAWLVPIKYGCFTSAASFRVRHYIFSTGNTEKTSAAIPDPVKTTKSNGPTESRIGVLRLLPTPSRRYMAYLHEVNATNIDVSSRRLEIM